MTHILIVLLCTVNHHSNERALPESEIWGLIPVNPKPANRKAEVPWDLHRTLAGFCGVRRNLGSSPSHPVASHIQKKRDRKVLTKSS